MEGQAEWRIMESLPGFYKEKTIDIFHIPCNNWPNWNYFYKEWKCVGCKKKIPDHVVLQWKILTGG